MRFAWDERKSRQNRSKHGVSFELATEVFFDPFCLMIPDRMVEDEERFWTVGRVEMLVVVRTLQDEHEEEVIRILSARKATPREKIL